MKKRNLIILISITLVLIISISTCLSANAEGVTIDYVGYANVHYVYWCSGQKNNAAVSSTTHTETVPQFGLALIEWIGLNARLLNTNNEIVSSSGYVFNQSPTSTMSVYTVKTISGTYKAAGTTMLLEGFSDTGGKIYNCDDIFDPVTLYFNNTSGSAAPSLPSSSGDIYGVTANGETYGSAAGISNPSDLPDLMSAVGINGYSGYIRNADMLENAYYVSDSKGTLSGHFIPVYDLDGNVIDTFELTGGYELDTSIK